MCVFSSQKQCSAAMNMKQLKVQSAIIHTTWQWAFLDSISFCKYTWNLVQNRLFLKKERYIPKSLDHALKMPRIIHLPCSSLLVVCRGGIWLESSLCKVVLWLSTHPPCFAAIAERTQQPWVGLTMPIFCIQLPLEFSNLYGTKPTTDRKNLASINSTLPVHFKY